MKVTREKAAEHRAAIVAAAARLFRAHGFEGVSVAQIMKEAGLTHGGFYGHFASKEALAAEACGAAFAETVGRLKRRTEPPKGDLGRYLDSYLSRRHRDSSETGCPMAAYATEIAREQAPVQARFAEGLEDYIATLQANLPTGPNESEPDRRQRAITLLAGLVGGLALSRASAATAPKLSAEILDAVRARIEALV